MFRMAIAGLTLLAAGLVRAQTAGPPVSASPSPIISQRAADLLPILNGGGVMAETFDATILAAVPEPQFRAQLAQLAGTLGRAVAVATVEARGAAGALVTIRYERGTAKFAMAVGPSGKVVGLRVAAVTPATQAASVAEIAATLRTLPGRTGFALADLGPGAPRMVETLAPDRPIALGSAFKLVILATIVADIEAGRRHWDDPITLDATERPAGGYRARPVGTRVPLSELARQMIAVSDNSATDILTDLLGRERIEAMQATVGWSNPARNRPWLTTMEAFKLKGVAGLGTRYLALNEAGRRAMLRGEVARTPGSAIGNLFADGRPVAIDTLEWFATPADLVRVMDWLRRHSESGPGAEARAILSANPGIGADVAGRYAFVGYKGGSEPGVITMTLLLKTRAGQWRVLTAGWNNPDAALDNIRFVTLVTRAAELAAD